MVNFVAQVSLRPNFVYWMLSVFDTFELAFSYNAHAQYYIPNYCQLSFIVSPTFSSSGSQSYFHNALMHAWMQH